jgi:integrase
VRPAFTAHPAVGDSANRHPAVVLREAAEVDRAKSGGGSAGRRKRKHGKPQLWSEEARRWVATGMAEWGESGAIAALVSLLMGMRASEITTRVARDLDDGGRLLWIPDSKTEAGKGTLRVPEVYSAPSEDIGAFRRL